MWEEGGRERGASAGPPRHGHTLPLAVGALSLGACHLRGLSKGPLVNREDSFQDGWWLLVHREASWRLTNSTFRTLCLSGPWSCGLSPGGIRPPGHTADGLPGPPVDSTSPQVEAGFCSQGWCPRS